MTARAVALTLYGTSSCHLCELAEEQLQRLVASRADLLIEVVDIAGDNALFERYGLRIPVLRTATGTELDWPFDVARIEAALSC